MIVYLFIFIFYLFFLKEILVQDHFYMKYSVITTSIWIGFICLPPLMTNLKLFYSFIFNKARRDLAWDIKNSHCFWQCCIFYHTYCSRMQLTVVFRWSRLNLLIFYHKIVASFLCSPKRIFTLTVYIYQLKQQTFIWRLMFKQITELLE